MSKMGDKTVALASFAAEQGLDAAGHMTFVHEMLQGECACCDPEDRPDEHWGAGSCGCDTCPLHRGAK